MILISWHRVRVIRDGEIIDEYVFPDEKIVDILDSLIDGNLRPIEFIIDKYQDEKIRFQGELNDLAKMHEVSIALAKRRLKKFLSDDYVLEQILSLYDDIVSTINLLSEREKEMHRIEEIKGETMEESDILRANISQLSNMREYLAERIKVHIENIAPNLGTLLGPLIAARIIHYAGGIKRLARMPSSTIQVLGAEDAFFQHLKRGTPCPKHGVIFQIAEIRNSPKKLRGKIARALAAKIAIAARVDYYGGEFIGDKLKEEFKRRVEEIINDSHRQR